MASHEIASAGSPLFTRGDRTFRTTGLAIGAIVGAGFAVLADLVDFGSLVGFRLPWSAATLLTGAFVGWALGPSSSRADGARAWSLIVVKQALVAVVVGSFTVATLGAFGLTVIRTGDLGAIPVALYASAGYGLLGILVLGWLILPIALVAAAVWSVVMRAVGRRP